MPTTQGLGAPLGLRRISPFLLFLLTLNGPLWPQGDEPRAAARRELDQVLSKLSQSQASFDDLVLGSSVAVDLGIWHHARSLADEATHRAPDRFEGYLWNGHALFRMAEDAVANSKGGGGLIRATFSDAAQAYAMARSKGAPAFDSAYFEAEARLMAMELEAGQRAVEAAIAAAPLASAPWSLKSRILIETRDGVGAAAAAAMALERSPADADAALLWVRGMTMSRSKTPYLARLPELFRQFPEEKRLYHAVAASVPNVMSASELRQLWNRELESAKPEHRRYFHWFLAALEERENRLDVALTHVREYVAAAPELPEGHWKQGWIHTSLGDLAAARVALLKSNALSPDFDREALTSAFRRLVAAHAAKQEYTPALRLQEVVTSLSIDPEDRLDLGVLQRMVGDLDLAHTTYRGLVESDEISVVLRAKTWNYIGLLENGRSRPTEAEAAFRQSLATDPDQADARENLGILLIEMKEIAAGLRELDQVLAVDPTRSRASYWRLSATAPLLREAPKK